MAQYNLTGEKFRLDIEVNDNGEISGVIETQGICDEAIWIDMFMVDGQITGPNTANLNVWDLVGGYRREFAKLRVEREDFVMTVYPTNDPDGYFRDSSRIERNPEEFLGENYPRPPICGDKKMKFLMETLNRDDEGDKED